MINKDKSEIKIYKIIESETVYDETGDIHSFKVLNTKKVSSEERERLIKKYRASCPQLANFPVEVDNIKVNTIDLGALIVKSRISFPQLKKDMLEMGTEDIIETIEFFDQNASGGLFGGEKKMGYNGRTYTRPELIKMLKKELSDKLKKLSITTCTLTSINPEGEELFKKGKAPKVREISFGGSVITYNEKGKILSQTKPVHFETTRGTLLNDKDLEEEIKEQEEQKKWGFFR